MNIRVCPYKYITGLLPSQEVHLSIQKCPSLPTLCTIPVNKADISDISACLNLELDSTLYIFKIWTKGLANYHKLYRHPQWKAVMKTKQNNNKLYFHYIYRYNAHNFKHSMLTLINIQIDTLILIIILSYHCRA